MSYERSSWNKGDIISSAKLTNIENGIAAAHDLIAGLNTTAEQNS